MLPGMKDKSRVNNTIKMDQAKVVDTIDIEDMGDKGVFCRLFLCKTYIRSDGVVVQVLEVQEVSVL